MSAQAGEMSGGHLAAIAAMGRNRVIGREGDLPWRLPDEMRHFMRTTLGRVCLMGRATYESMDGPLPKRTNLVLTRDTGWRPRSGAIGVEIAHDLDRALAMARELAGAEACADPDRCPVICGGATLYEATLPRVDRLILTVVDAEPEGDTHFPAIDPGAWAIERRVHHPADDRHVFGFEIRFYTRSGS